ncbi:transposase [Marininema mesophilum]|uniref:Transposase n=1 Tax=Marininema mesophilum TaxID=1048340 RepID=A0A1H2TT38_9BACL|nr:helix-turn-helix domain-containing protein [Marininema mesophilum]SDW47052.1 transposase [Marininema mesophilum]
MGKQRKTYSVEFKQKAVNMYLRKNLGYKRIAKELEIQHSMVKRWVQRYQQEGKAGLEEKRGLKKGDGKGRPRSQRPPTMEEELHRLRAENEYLKKLWELERGRD